MYTKTRNAHWNIVGPDFYDKHKFFEAQYEELDEIMDSVAERVRTLGHFAVGSLKDFLKLTHLTETEATNNKSVDYIAELLQDHEGIIIFLRENITRFADELKDLGTSDFITGIMETHEKMAWILRAHLQ